MVQFSHACSNGSDYWSSSDVMHFSVNYESLLGHSIVNILSGLIVCLFVLISRSNPTLYDSIVCVCVCVCVYMYLCTLCVHMK